MNVKPKKRKAAHSKKPSRASVAAPVSSEFLDIKNNSDIKKASTTDDLPEHSEHLNCRDIARAYIKKLVIRVSFDLGLGQINNVQYAKDYLRGVVRRLSTVLEDQVMENVPVPNSNTASNSSKEYIV